MEFITVPEQIESRSMEIIAPYLAEYNLSPKEIKIFRNASKGCLAFSSKASD